MPEEMKVICPHCGYDHERELKAELDAWVSDDSYVTVCRCEKEFIVHTHVTYSFSTSKVRR